MTTSENYFKKFIQNISPDDGSSENAQTAHNQLREYLEEKDIYIDSFLYGSYKRFTAIHDIDDVDISIILDIDLEDEDSAPKKILRKLKKDISDYYSDIEWYDEDNTEYNRRSILVKDALPYEEDSNLTLDVIPAVEVEDEDYLLVPDRELEKWVKTNPLWHVDFSQTMNTEKNSKGLFISVVKVFKHLKKFHIKNKHPKWFWIETLVWLNYVKKDTIIESFYCTLVEIINKYWNYSKIPELDDIWLDWEKIKTSMEFKDFEKFMELLKNINDDLFDAINSDDKEYSLNIYRNIFWEEYFPITLEKTYNENINEEFITTKYGYIEDLDDNFYVSIECSTLINWEMLPWKKRKKIKVSLTKWTHIKTEKIKFEYSTNCPRWTEFLWKVRNYWDSPSDSLRWTIWKYTNMEWLTNNENIAYYWTHTVECFAVYNNKVIAKDLFRVNVKKVN